MNKYLGLEQFMNWENAGVCRGNLLTEKEYNKLSDSEKAKIHVFDFNGETKEYEVVDHKNIWHHGKSTERPVIELDIKFHNTIYKSEKVNLKISDLTGTKHYRCRMLLSKQFMSRANIVIDPSKTFELTDKKELKKKKDKNA